MILSHIVHTKPKSTEENPKEIKKMCHDGTALESQCKHSQFPSHDEDNDFDNNNNGDDD